MKQCLKCSEAKPIDDFRKGKNRCRSCEREENLTRYHSGGLKESHKKSAIKFNLKKYGLTLEEFEILWDSQGGQCKICGVPIKKHGEFTVRSEGAMVDHCHKSGKVRGLLCLECNTGLGKFKDNVDLMKAAINYLEVNLESS